LLEEENVKRSTESDTNAQKVREMMNGRSAFMRSLHVLEHPHGKPFLNRHGNGPRNGLFYQATCEFERHRILPEQLHPQYEKDS